MLNGKKVWMAQLVNWHIQNKDEIKSQWKIGSILINAKKSLPRMNDYLFLNVKPYTMKNKW